MVSYSLNLKEIKQTKKSIEPKITSSPKKSQSFTPDLQENEEDQEKSTTDTNKDKKKQKTHKDRSMVSYS